MNRQGRFVARGDSFEFHQEVIRGVIQRYRRFVEMVEERAVQWVELVGGGAEMRGSAICVRFSKAVPDRDLLLEELFSSREPLRLWVYQSSGMEYTRLKLLTCMLGSAYASTLVTIGYASTCSTVDAATPWPGS